MTTLNPDGSANISPLSSFWALGNRVVLGLGTDGQGMANLSVHGECVLNFPSESQAWQVEALARATGRSPVPSCKSEIGYTYARDKFALAGFSELASAEVGVPSIAECPLQVEARLLRIHTPDGESSQGFGIVEGEVLCIHAHEEITVPATEHVNVQRWRPLLYMFRHYMGVTGPLARNFRAGT